MNCKYCQSNIFLGYDCKEANDFLFTYLHIIGKKIPLTGLIQKLSMNRLEEQPVYGLPVMSIY